MEGSVLAAAQGWERRIGKHMVDLEICVDSVESAIAAEQGGAQRIELCSALSEGGITPSSGMIRAVREAVDIDLFLMIRPRGGDFVYSPRELEVMQRDIQHAKEMGADGVVLGALTVDDRVDVSRTLHLVQQARPLQVTFHRAFDVCADLETALEEVIACGADRLLTSGGRPDAVLGTRPIARLREASADRIRIMAGGGVRRSNVAHIVRRTGIRDVHTSLLGSRDAVESDGAGSPTIYLHAERPSPCRISSEDVRQFRMALDTIALGMPSQVP